MGQPVNIAGKRFGKLVALKYSGIFGIASAIAVTPAKLVTGS
ncbi:hypothetical protein [Klebsiella quasipneumoniae]|nr:hypothetical protein [Klebsiella quasipneumoniae]